MMISRRNLVIFLVTCIVCTGLVSDAWAEKTVTVAVGGDVPFMKEKDAKGNLVGYEIDMIREVAKEAGFSVKIVEVPWKSLFDGLNTGKYDAVIAQVNITPGRKDRFEISEPYFRAAQVLVVPKSRQNDPVTGKNIGVFRLSRAADTIRRSGCNLTYYTVQETPQAFRDLQKGSVDGILCDMPVALGYTRNKSSGLAISTACPFDADAAEDFGIVCKKGNSSLVRLINEGLSAVKDKNLDKAIASRWFKDTRASGMEATSGVFASETVTGPQNSPSPSKR